MLEKSKPQRLRYTEAEIEEARAEEIQDYGPVSGDPSPGSFYCHEALHMASYLHNQVQENLLSHPSIMRDPEWYRAAFDASNALWHLYQMIGDQHLTPVIDKEDFADILKRDQPGLSRSDGLLILDFTDGNLDEAFDAAEAMIAGTDKP